MIYVIEKLWWDPMENHNSHGYEAYGYVETEEEAIEICKEVIPFTVSPYPLQYIKNEDSNVRLYRYRPIRKVE